jgi:hypothetical protein
VIKTADWIIDLGPKAWPGLDPGASDGGTRKEFRRRSRISNRAGLTYRKNDASIGCVEINIHIPRQKLEDSMATKYTIRQTKSGTRVTTRTKFGNTTITRTTGAGKKARTTTSTRIGNTTYTRTK